MRMFLALALLMPVTASAVPLELTHQGRLFDALGVPLDGDHVVDVKLFDDAATGTELWADNSTVSFDQGYYVIGLGTGTSMDASVLAGDDVYLELTIDSGSPLPRTKLSSVPFAVRAMNAATADELAPGSVVNADELQIGGTTVIDSSGVLVNPTTPSAHTHDTVDIVSGTLIIDRLPVGSSASEVAAGDHSHDITTLTGQLADSQLPTNMGTVVDGYVTDGPLDFDAGSTLGGAAISTGAHYADGDAVAAVEGAAALALGGDVTVSGALVADSGVNFPNGNMRYSRWSLNSGGAATAGVITVNGINGASTLDIANAPNPGDLFVNAEGTLAFRRGDASTTTPSELFINIEGGSYACTVLHSEDDAARAPLWLGTDGGNCCNSIWGNDTTSTARIRNEGYHNNVFPNYAGYVIACF